MKKENPYSKRTLKEQASFSGSDAQERRAPPGAIFFRKNIPTLEKRQRAWEIESVFMPILRIFSRKKGDNFLENRMCYRFCEEKKASENRERLHKNLSEMHSVRVIFLWKKYRIAVYRRHGIIPIK